MSINIKYTKKKREILLTIYYTIPYYIPHHTTQYNTIQYNTIQYNTIPHHIPTSAIFVSLT